MSASEETAIPEEKIEDGTEKAVEEEKKVKKKIVPQQDAGRSG